MKIISNPRQDLSSIGTAVFYKWHPFIPDPLDYILDRNTLVKDTTAAEVLHLSSTTQTGLLDFGEYNFQYRPQKPKYHEKLLSQWFSQSTAETLGYDSSVLEKVCSRILPQAAGSDSRDPGIGYFGMSEISGQSIVLLDVPGDIWTMNQDGNETRDPGIWKIELYQEETDRNCAIGFLEYSVLESLGITPEIAPILTIILGPSQEVTNNTSDMYYPGYSYPVQTTTMTTSDWTDLEQEITARKVVYIIISSSGSLKNINLSYSAWSQTPNPNRNEDQYRLRGDLWLASRNWIEPVSSSETLVDSRSDILLGTRKLEPSEYPILNEKLSRSSGIWSPSRSYKVGEVVSDSGETWISVASGNLGNSPVYSGTWIQESGVLDGTDYIELSVSVADSEMGQVVPCGQVSAKAAATKLKFKTIPNVGYEFPIAYLKLLAGKEGTTSAITVGGIPFDTRYLEVIDDSWISLSGISVSSDLVFSFQPIESKLVILMYVSQDWYGNSGKSNEFSYPDYPVGVEIEAYVNGTKTGFSDSGTIDSGIGDMVLIRPTTTPDCPYLISGFGWTRAESDKVIDSSFTIQNVDYSDRELYIFLESKKCLVQVTEYEGGEVSKTGGYTEYGQPWSVQFYPKTGYWFSGVSLKSGSQEIPDPNQILLVSTDSVTGISTLSIDSVKDNYDIEIIFKEV